MFNSNSFSDCSNDFQMAIALILAAVGHEIRNTTGNFGNMTPVA